MNNHNHRMEYVMKKTIYRVLTVILIFALIAGLSTAYAESSKDCTGQKGPAGPDDAYYYSFSLEADYINRYDYGVSRQKVLPYHYASYRLTSIINSTGCQFYINVRNTTYQCIAGTARTIASGSSAPLNFHVSYLSAYGNVGSYYYPSMQVSSYATHGSVSVSGR